MRAAAVVDSVQVLDSTRSCCLRWLSYQAMSGSPNHASLSLGCFSTASSLPHSCANSSGPGLHRSHRGPSSHESTCFVQDLNEICKGCDEQSVIVPMTLQLTVDSCKHLLCPKYQRNLQKYDGQKRHTADDFAIDRRHIQAPAFAKISTRFAGAQ